MLRGFLILSFFICVVITNHAQDNSPKGFSKEKVFWGGNIGASFGTITNLDISPTVGYYFTPKIAGGLGFTYQYFEDKRMQPSIKLSIVGTRVFTRFYPLEQLFFHGEYEFLNYRTNVYSSSGTEMQGINVSSLLGGGGYRYAIGSRSSAYIMVLYNFTETIYTPYSNPVIRVGVDFGF